MSLSWVDCLPYYTFTERLRPVEIEDVSPPNPNNDRQKVLDATKYVEEVPFAKVKASADADDSAMRVELGIRAKHHASYFTGCGIPMNKEAALTIWEDSTDDEWPGDWKTPQRAYLCLCLASLEAYKENRLLDDLLKAAQHANMAIAVETDFSLSLAARVTTFVPAALEAAKLFSYIINALSTPAMAHVDQEGQDWIRDQIEEIPLLWNVFKRRVDVVERSEAKQEQKIAKAPNAYECARDGCGIGSTTKRALLRCSGPCPIEIKPHYCSRDCQVADWKNHKKQCKQRESSSPNALTILPTPKGAGPSSQTAKQKGKISRPGYTMTVPGPSGGGTTIVSSTMTPEFMREVRDHLESMIIKDEVD